MKKFLLLNLFFFTAFTTLASRVDSSGIPADTTGNTGSMPGKSLSTLPGSKYNIVSVSDGSGGSFLVWQNSNHHWTDTISVVENKVYVQHLSPSGTALWGNGILAGSSSRQQSYPVIVSDNAGGVIIFWNEYDASTNWQVEEASYDVMAQRISYQGTRLWGQSGKVITNAPGVQYVESVVAYGNSGAIVAWDGGGAYLAIVSADGSVVKGPIQVSASENTYVEEILPAENGNFSVFYYDEYETPTDSIEMVDCYMQSFNSNGTALFASGGVKFLTVSDEGPEIEVNDIISDGNGGVYILIVDEDNNNKQYLQHVLSNGTLAFGAPFGIVVDESTSGTGQLVSDKNGGVVVIWQDQRSIATQSSLKGTKFTLTTQTYGVFAQRFNSSGTKLWGGSDITVKADGTVDDGLLTGLADDNGNFFIIFPGPISNGTSIIAQKLSSAGALQWPAAGIVVDDTPNSGYKYDVSLITSGGNLVVIWPGESGTSTSIFSQVIAPDGTTLPLKLLDFQAALKREGVKLTWKTAFEINNDHFEILRSYDGKGFLPIGNVTGSGNSNSIKQYSFTDKTFAAGPQNIYYRLKQIDKDGQATLSAIVQINPTSIDQTFSLYPIPARDQISVSYNAPFNYRIVDTNGREIISGGANAGITELNLSTLNAGLFIIELRSGSEKISKKFVKL